MRLVPVALAVLFLWPIQRSWVLRLLRATFKDQAFSDIKEQTMTTNSSLATRTLNPAGLFTLALRLVVGWTYFSAFWRRVALENKLDPEVAGYIGEKFNHFLLFSCF